MKNKNTPEEMGRIVQEAAVSLKNMRETIYYACTLREEDGRPVPVVWGDLSDSLFNTRRIEDRLFADFGSTLNNITIRYESWPYG